MPDTRTDLGTLWETCANAESEALFALHFSCPEGINIAVERIHRDLIDALTIVGRLEAGAADTEPQSHIGETK